MAADSMGYYVPDSLMDGVAKIYGTSTTDTWDDTLAEGHPAGGSSIDRTLLELASPPREEGLRADRPCLDRQPLT
jgi:hypothetical protein